MVRLCCALAAHVVPSYRSDARLDDIALLRLADQRGIEGLVKFCGGAIKDKFCEETVGRRRARREASSTASCAWPVDVTALLR